MPPQSNLAATEASRNTDASARPPSADVAAATAVARQEDDSPLNSIAQSASPWWKLKSFLFLLFLDSLTNAILLNPFLTSLHTLEDVKDHYTFYSSLWDLSLLSILRITSSVVVLLRAYYAESNQTQPHQSSTVQSESPFYHPNGDRKSNTELEEEWLEEPCWPQVKRYVGRNALLPELLIFITSILVMIKCLARLNIEIGVLDEHSNPHLLFWATLGLTGLFLILEVSYIDSMEQTATECGRQARKRREGRQPSSSLMQPLLLLDDEEVTPVRHNHHQASPTPATGASSDRRSHDRQRDTTYKATWADLFRICAPDKYWVLCASVFLIFSAIANVYIPRYTGEILDVLVAHSSDNPNRTAPIDASLITIPGFLSNIQMLILVSILSGIFGGIRGAIFSVVGARVNVRLRLSLMDSLLSQDISFFETTRTGDLSSRLSSDTTQVGSTVTTQVNIFLRAIVTAVGSLIFMVGISWQLALLAFLTVPVISVWSKWYGKYVRRLSKLQQKKLAEGNAVSESAISAMATVRAFGAETVELDEFTIHMQKYLTLNIKTATATFGYSTCVQALPQLMQALILFYGGLLVVSDGPDHITGGQLVTFILYLSSLSDSFNSLGGIFASLTRAVGAADKVFELMHRPSRLIPPSQGATTNDVRNRGDSGGPSDVRRRTTEYKTRGLRPAHCRGEIVFRSVCLRYPSRPQRLVLDHFNLAIPSGSVVALVGASGSGKSSVLSLIQHLYDASSGDVLIDDTPVHELCPDWLYSNVSVVSQEPTLFARSIKKNIIYGLDEAEVLDEEVYKAAALANASLFVERLPFGYETNIGERGVQLSGGQKQRLAIARALVRKPKILLLDEATSSLDAESEAVVQEAIDDMINGQRDSEVESSMTVVIVAHRLSTVRNADIIFVVDNGAVVEQGSHDELVVKEGGAYNALISRQISAHNKLDFSEYESFPILGETITPPST